MLNDMSLRIRIVLMTILAIFLPLIASDLYVFKREVDEWYDINGDSLYSSSAHISQDIDRWLNSKKSLARHIAESSLVRDFCTKYANSKLSKQEKDKLVKDFYNKAGTSAFLSTDIAELAISDLGECVPEDKLEKYIDNLSDRHVMNLNGNSPAEVAKKIVGGRGYGRPQYIGGNIFYSTSKEDIGMSWMPLPILERDDSDPMHTDNLSSVVAPLMRRLNDGDTVLFKRLWVSTEMVDEDNFDNANYNRQNSSYVATFIYSDADNSEDTPENSVDRRTPVAILTLRIMPGLIQNNFEHENFYLVDPRGQIIAMPRNINKSVFEQKELKPKAEKVYGAYTYKLRVPEDYRGATGAMGRDEAGQWTRAFVNYRNFYDKYRHPVENSREIPEPEYKLSNIYVNIFGEKVIGAWHPCKEIDWFVLSEKDQREFYQYLHESVYVSMLITVAIGLPFVAFAFWTAGNLADPIIKLSKAAAKIAGGDHTTRCNIVRHDEIGILSRAFDTMASRIEKTMTELKRARDEALEASRAKSNFLNTMSHELRTPLSAIINYSEIIMDNVNDRNDDMAEDDLDNANSIHIAGLNLLSVINDILNVSRLESGRMGLFVDSFDLKDLLAEVRASINSLASNKNNVLEIVGKDDSLTLNTDHAKLRQIIINVMGNSAKFTENGHIRLVIEIWDAKRAQEELYKVDYIEIPGTTIVDTEFEPDTQVIVLSMQDDGIGMTQDKFSKIFEEFTQADNSISRTYGGTGLGLALVQNFTKMIYGRLELLSQEGRGSAFTLKLPLKWPKNAPTNVSNASEILGTPSKGSKASKASKIEPAGNTGKGSIAGKSSRKKGTGGTSVGVGLGISVRRG